MKNLLKSGVKFLEKSSLHMDNSIYHQQNNREILLLQKAQRSKYTEAKKVLYPGLYLSITGTVIFAILTSLYDIELLNTLSSFSAIALFAFTSYLEKKANVYIELAAKIQQTMDVKLFQMPDKCHVLLSSEIKEITASYNSEQLVEFENWYNDYSSLDFLKQVFLSQKENIRWDQKLREKYSCLITALVIGCPILLLIYIIFTNATASSLFAMASWLFPLEQFLITQWIGLRDNINNLKAINEEYRSIEKCYEKYSPSEIQCKLCGLQTYIFEHRKRSIMIPDWFYKKHKSKMQKYEDDVAAETLRKD